MVAGNAGRIRSRTQRRMRQEARGDRLGARALAGASAFLRDPCAMCLGEQWWIAVRAARHGSLVSDPDLGWPTRVGTWSRRRMAQSPGRSTVSLRPNGLPIDNGSGEPPAAPAWEVWAFDSHGQRVLDSGPNLELHSLELNGSTLTWIKDGTTRSARSTDLATEEQPDSGQRTGGQRERHYRHRRRGTARRPA